MNAFVNINLIKEDSYFDMTLFKVLKAHSARLDCKNKVIEVAERTKYE
jgi:hypothetical protein